MLIKKHLVFKDVFLLHFTVEVPPPSNQPNPLYTFFLYIIAERILKHFLHTLGSLKVNKDDNVHRFVIREGETKSMTWRVT